MKKKVLATLLCAAMVGTMLTACGSSTDTSSSSTTTDTSTTTETSTADTSTEEVADAADEEVESTASEEGTVLNIYCWNEEFKSRLEDHYPGYEVIDGTTGKIGDVTVNYIITPSDDNAYQNKLDEDLPNNESVADDSKIDIFLIEADYALKYIDSDYAMAISDLGITDSDLSKQYQYTKDIVTDSNGVLKGVSWQGCPGVLFYNRAAALEVLGTDDPDEVQEYVKDWDTFNATADLLKDAGYNITSTVNDSYRVYSNNVSTPWVVDGVITIDDNIVNWVNDSKELVDKGETTTAELWSDDWSQGFFPEGKVFCYFGPAWLVNFSMSADEEGSIGYEGGWGACPGPQGFYWGGTWICAATGTDNPSLVKDIILTMTTDDSVMQEIVEQDDDFVNNTTVMNTLADPSSGYTSAILGGQNPLSMYIEGVSDLSLDNLSIYDQGCNEEFQGAMKNYFEGNATYEEALDLFYTAVVEKYPELTY